MTTKAITKRDQAETEVLDSGGDLITRWTRAETAFDLVRLKGKSLRAAAQELGVSHETVWRDVRAYESYLAATNTTGTMDERRAAFLAQCQDIMAEARKVLADFPDKSLTRVAALNTMSSVLTHVRAVQGLDSPKEQAKPQGPAQFRVGWAKPGQLEDQDEGQAGRVQWADQGY